ncbi:ribonuclease D [Algicola sagamiensis]|uniref:ribonuclease D n=1 Tax=Algicola sagamiensis TaxID=163869 RepID=UPI000363E6FD|nr:ribonuclease D [Algicola sagamiensis]
MLDFRVITTQEELTAYCQAAQKQSYLMMDTEFIRDQRRSPALGLIQLNDGQNIALVDPLNIDDLSPLWSLMEEEGLLKVLHSCSEDLEAIRAVSGKMPTPLFDTQVAANFLGEGPSLGYGFLVEKHLGVSLSKEEARTDWLARPLTDAQLKYAAADVLYLLDIFLKQKALLEEKELLDYVLAEGALITQKKSREIPLSCLYFDVKNSWQLKPRELAILRELAIWREELSREIDLTPSVIVKEHNLSLIAQRRPGNEKSLRNIPGLMSDRLHKYTKEVLACVERGKDVPPEHCPPVVSRLIEYPDYKKTLKHLKHMIQECAKALNIPETAIASKKQINQLIAYFWQLNPEVRHQEWKKPDLLHGWRYEVAGRVLEKEMTHDET